MSTVKILTDSCAGFEPEEAEALGVYVVPLSVTIGDEVFLDGDPDITDHFFEAQDKGLPATVSAPSVRSFEQAYEYLHKQSDQILALHVSGKLSATFKNSRLGSERLRGRCHIEVVDTASIMLGQSILVKAAAQAAREGADMDEIIRRVRGLIPHVYTVLYVETMDYLEKSQTIGKAQAILGTMMQIKPLLFMEDGEIIPMEKVRTTERAIDKLTEFVAEFDTLEQTAIIQRSTKPTRKTRLLLERLSLLFPDEKFPVMQYNPLLATYVGPTALGIIVYEGLTGF
ncbi:MAG: DegV family protein [Caldilineae bacterium]|nr:MAG: DegV family protein [Caldilineae bacterium]